MRIEEDSRLAGRMQRRRPEIAQAVLTRVYGIDDPAETKDPAYMEGLRAAVNAAIDYGLEAVERSEGRAPPIPTALLSQARLAARNGISLDIVLRRYFAGYTLFGDFLIEETERSLPMRRPALKRLLRAQAALFEGIIGAVSEEYRRERKARRLSVEERRAERVKRALAGEPLDLTELSYDLDCWHLAAVATGESCGEQLQQLATAFDRRLLCVRVERGISWAWLGGRKRIESTEIATRAVALWPDDSLLALGESARGVSGWRLSHRQALAALLVAQRGFGTVVRHADVGLLASILHDEVLSASLRQRYLEPLADKHGGRVLRETLRAYFAAGGNVSSAAAALGVTRQTVGNRLRAVEARLEQALDQCSVEIELALRLEEGELGDADDAGATHVLPV